MKKRAFITGITGQDGSYLAELLIGKGYEVHGLVRRASGGIPEWLESMVSRGDVVLHAGNVQDLAAVRLALEAARPDEVYNLAAQSHVGVSFKCPDETREVNYYGVGRVVNEALRVNPSARIYQASTSEMFGSTPPPQNENSPFAPVSPYAEAKFLAHEHFIKGYRARGAFACSGILFNHESPRRGKEFVTRKITRGLVRVKLGLEDSLALGNLEAKRDWGFAGDYVKAMHAMLQEDEPNDYVVATGKTHSVREFVEVVCNELAMSIEWRGEGLEEVGMSGGKVILTISKEFYRPNEVNHLLGDSRKAHERLGWQPIVTFEELMRMMVRADFESQKHLT